MKTVAAASMPATPSSQSAVQPTRPYGCTNLKLRQLMRRVAQHYDVELARSGLKTTQYSLLTCLAKLGPQRPADLAAVLKIDASTLTRNLAPIVAAGWAVQSAGPDGRSRTVTLTEAGREKRLQAQRHWKAAQDGLNATLGMARVAALHQLVDESMALLSAEADASVGVGAGA
ncbi:MAG: MarR family transcriptional regulator [Rhodoferax sp.]|nr:MarR family transcriptional regulator [Rhodoferax sp.]